MRCPAVASLGILARQADSESSTVPADTALFAEAVAGAAGIAETISPANTDGMIGPVTTGMMEKRIAR